MNREIGRRLAGRLDRWMFDNPTCGRCNRSVAAGGRRKRHFDIGAQGDALVVGHPRDQMREGRFSRIAASWWTGRGLRC